MFSDYGVAMGIEKRQGRTLVPSQIALVDLASAVPL
jgi:hypothetical protein